MNRKDLQNLTLVVPPCRDNQEVDPLAVLHLDNQLCVYSLNNLNQVIPNIEN